MSAAVALYTEEEFIEPTIVCDMRAVVSTFMLPPPRPFYKRLDVTPDPRMSGKWRLLGFDAGCQEWVELINDADIDDCLAATEMYK